MEKQNKKIDLCLTSSYSLKVQKAEVQEKIENKQMKNMMLKYIWLLLHMAKELAPQY